MENRSPQTSKTIVRNVFYGFLTWILPFGLSFVTTPVIVRNLGDADYGIYALVLGFIGYSFTFNIGRAITKYVAEYRVNDENEKIRDVISATVFVHFAVGLLGILVLVLSAEFLVRDVFNIDSGAQGKTIAAMYIASGIIFFLMLNQVFNAVLQGVQRFDVYSKIFNINSFAMILGNLILAYTGFGLLALLSWNLLVTAVSSVVCAVSAKKLLPEFGISFRFKRETLLLVLRYSFGIVGYQILANALLIFERVWITRGLGTETLTYYVVPMSLGIFMHSFISSLMLVIFPLASELKNEKEKLFRLYAKATKISSLLVVFFGTTLIVQSEFFLTLWMGAGFAEKSSSLLIFHTITFGLTAIAAVSWQMTEGLGYPNFNFAVFSICVIVSIPLMLILTKDFGSVGIAIARLAGFGTIFFSIFYVEKWIFKKVQVGLWLSLTSTLSIAAIFAALLEMLVIRNLSVSWFAFFLSVACGGIGYGLILWMFKFVTADEKVLIRGILGR